MGDTNKALKEMTVNKLVFWCMSSGTNVSLSLQDCQAVVAVSPWLSLVQEDGNANISPQNNVAAPGNHPEETPATR